MSVPFAGPRRASIWIPAATVAAAGLALAALAAAADRGRPDTLPLAIAVALLTLGALLRPFEPAPGEKFSLAAAIAFFGVLVLPGAQAIAAVVAAETVARLVRRTSAVSSLVNVGKSAGAVAAAAAAAGSLRLSPVLAPDLLEVIVAGGAYLALTLAIVAAMIGWTQGAAGARAFVAREWLPTSTLLVIGALGAAVFASAPLLIVLLALPLAMVEVAGRGAARLRDAHGALARALDAQRAFVADAAHELRNPLAAIRGNLAFVRDEPLASDEAGALADARRDLTYLSGLVDRLLVLSRVDARPEGAAHADLSATVCAIAPALPRRAGVALDLDVRDGICVAVPAELVEALVREVVGNAAAYTEHGFIRASVRADGSSALFEVRDTGVGIAAPERSRVFDRFYRGGAARRLGPGSGLGLAIVRGIAEAHGGTVSLGAAAGGGTSVVVRLPLN